MTTITIATDFARYPFGRYRSDGANSGERFRDDFLVPALRRESGDLEIIVDGAIGMGSSFLEEAFGGLVRVGFEKSMLTRRLKIVSSRDKTLVSEIMHYIDVADAKKAPAHA